MVKTYKILYGIISFRVEKIDDIETIEKATTQGKIQETLVVEKVNDMTEHSKGGTENFNDPVEHENEGNKNVIVDGKVNVTLFIIPINMLTW